MIRTLIWLLVVGALIFFGATVNLGKRTLFGHIANIWSSDEAHEMREDVGKTTRPVLDKAGRAAKAGWREYRKDDPARDAGPPAEAPR
jgi:hypothetical protein